jgi:hypothetical protein
MFRTDLKLLGHIGNHERLADCLPAGNRQRLVGIGDLRKIGSDEVLARHFLHGAQDGLIADPSPAQRELKLHTLDVIGCWIGGHDYLVFSPQCRRLLPFCANATHRRTCECLLDTVNSCWQWNN